MKLKQTREPVTPIAGAIAAPEPPRSLTWCYVALVIFSSAAMAMPPSPSIPNPTALEKWAAKAVLKKSEVVGAMEAGNSRVEVISVVLTRGSESEKGLQLVITSDSRKDSILLNQESVSILQYELENRLSPSDKCKSKRCIMGLARCWPGYASYEPQRLCLESYVAKDDSYGVVITTPEGPFVFEGVEPTSFAEVFPQ